MARGKAGRFDKFNLRLLQTMRYGALVALRGISIPVVKSNLYEIPDETLAQLRCKVDHKNQVVHLATAQDRPSWPEFMPEREEDEDDAEESDES